ncbi:MAG: DUF58 domain-containing protein, partial [Promicromonosporaceae bacterium]|nr:DUF58 domain-containing protein [Promicromonosporaceae bacterium]
MVITWRAVALMGLGIGPTLLWPTSGTVLLWTALMLLIGVADALLAASPRRVELTRAVPPSVRLGESVRSTLVVTNLGRRSLRAIVRDAWPPSVAASPSMVSTLRQTQGGAGSITVSSARHRVSLRPGEAIRLATPLQPARRGDQQAGPVTIRSLGPLRVAGRQATLRVPVRLRVLPEFASRRHLPSRLARLRELDGSAVVQVRGEGTEF